MGWTFDGTLAHYDGWVGPEHIGEPIPAMVARVKMWRRQGRDVRIFTARANKHGHPDGFVRVQIKIIEAWCLQHIGEILPITCEKDLHMVCLYDDRCKQVEINTGRIIGEGCSECNGS